LAVVGGIYVVAALAVLVRLLVDVWQAPGSADLLTILALIGAGACGAWFVLNALENLGRRPERSRRYAAAASNPASIHK
jgi:hypothetical protein